MKAISLWQPWASLWLTPAKVHETRHWPTSHRGWLLVHAAKRTIDDYEGDDALDQICDRIFGAGWSSTLPRGALLGIVNVVDCVRTEKILQGYQEPTITSAAIFPKAATAGVATSSTSLTTRSPTGVHKASSACRTLSCP